MKALIAEELIEEIRSSNDIVDVVSEYTRLQKRGQNYFGLCKFHREKTPSLCISPAKQIFYCFGCGKGGNVIHFVMGAENLDFINAVKFLADRARIIIPEGDGTEERNRSVLRKEILNINKEAAVFYNQNLSQSQKAKMYLKERGISQNTIIKFGLGYTGSEWDALYKHLAGTGKSETVLAASGLFTKSKEGKNIDRFRERIMFPIFDINGNVVGFGGRTTGQTDNFNPKYINSPESLVYNKGKNLYALNFARKTSPESLIVVEGYMDAIALHQYGITNAVASLGTSLTDGQARLLSKYSQEVIISYDSDAAGQAATLRGLEILGDTGCRIKVLSVPDGKDPDEFLKNHGGDAYRELINKATPYIQYRISVLKKNYNLDTTTGKIEFLKKAAGVLSKVASSVERSMYTTIISREYGINEDVFDNEIKRQMSGSYNSYKAVESMKEAGNKAIAGYNEENRNDHYEKLLIAMICSSPDIYGEIENQCCDIDRLLSDSNRKVLDILKAQIKNSRLADEADFLNLLTPEEAACYSGILSRECIFDDKRKAFKGIIDSIHKIKDNNSKKRMEEIIKLLENRNNISEREVNQLTEELNELLRSISGNKNNRIGGDTVGRNH